MMVPEPTDSSAAHARAALALSLLQHRRHDDRTVELAVMALRGATVTELVAAERQMAGG